MVTAMDCGFCGGRHSPSDACAAKQGATQTDHTEFVTVMLQRSPGAINKAFEFSGSTILRSGALRRRSEQCRSSGGASRICRGPERNWWPRRLCPKIL